MSFCECSGAHQPWFLQYPSCENVFFRIRPHAFWVAFWMGIWVFFVTYWSRFGFKIVVKKHSSFGCVFYWIFDGFWEAWGGSGSPKMLPKTMPKTTQKKHEKKEMQVMRAIRDFPPGGRGVPYKIPAGSGPRDKEWKQCSKRPDKTLWPLHFVPQGHGGGYMYIYIYHMYK